MTSYMRPIVALLCTGALGAFGHVAHAASTPTVTAAPASRGLAVNNVRIDGTGEGRRVIISLNREPSGVRKFALSDPPRVVVDIEGPMDGVGDDQARFPVEDEIVRGIRTAPYEGRLRVVLDLARDLRLERVDQAGHKLIAVLGEPDLAADKKTARGSAAEEAPPAAKTVRSAPTSPAVARAVPTLTDTPIVTAAAPKVAPAPARAEASTATAAPATISPLIRTALSDALEPAPAARPSSRPLHVSARAPSRPRIMAVKPSPSGFKGQRISLDFKDADIQNVLRVLADVSGLNIIATDDVVGKVTLHLKDVPWDQAFDLILKTNRLEKTQEGNVVRISTVGRLTQEREALLAASQAETEIEPLQVKYIRVNYARADELLIDKVRGVLTQRGSVTFDDRTNTVIVRDIGAGVVDASDLVRRLDVQSPQVLIEANIVEATEEFGRGLGVQWGYSYKAGPETGNPTGMNFPGTVGLGGSGLGFGNPPPGNGSGAPRLPVPFLADFPVPSNFGSGFGPGTGSALDLALGSLDGTQTLNARLTALEDTGKGRVVSRPRVITMNNVAATIQSLTILRVKLPSTGTVINTGAGGAAGSASSATEKINTGITLVVTPQVSSDGYVLMSIFAKSSQPDFARSVDGIPNEISREANSNVLVRSGETVVLGGIYRQTTDDRESGLPYLRSIPVFGWLFKRQLKSDRKEELLVFLTPKIIESGTASLPPAERLWESRPRG
jgi:type IV pilus secretin PilQ/predicted competence protein